ncbi:tRNA (guanosine(46)-N7)-methyltransferase TrmB [Candidatus Epulonipiscium fishelsonii]|uniref:tRNA (Guanosine(46)-N7)-methyltransferase TrmB n=1 Tax=Candidatus Epulonipiscium fishelsonii TaxID=77094 RepID=A0ACC8X858_9FIRM|nr:tRNA (guanosine(46)-N7)-methyltransferase TrmB [Epulopiscium sp. SCG-B11WGA-EpuloA1]ONI43081.1 tRNA (guanosine(46)-N7)-methyltransferase TrmB [Epulopiscium sp. SCG-B05WGA-EpuloA1]
MRLRKDARAEKYLEEENKVIKNPQTIKGKWNIEFNNENEIFVEFGCGKGDFALEMVKAYPNINFIAIEKFETVLYKACKKANAENGIPQNLRFLNIDVESCIDIFGSHELSRIYLNFSDPWPKNKYAKRRLTYRKFLDKYKSILKPSGEIHFKTDNKQLFAFSIEEFSYSKWLIKNVSLDLHNSNFKNNIITEYERKFSELGYTINRLEAIPPSN